MRQGEDEEVALLVGAAPDQDLIVAQQRSLSCRHAEIDRQYRLCFGAGGHSLGPNA